MSLLIVQGCVILNAESLEKVLKQRIKARNTSSIYATGTREIRRCLGGTLGRVSSELTGFDSRTPIPLTLLISPQVCRPIAEHFLNLRKSPLIMSHLNEIIEDAEETGVTNRSYSALHHLHTFDNNDIL